MSELDETMAATSTSLSLPGFEVGANQTIAGRYRIDRLLGIGGMGRVYGVADEELGEVVALKMLRAELLESNDALDRFRKEVKLARRVTHRNVARIFDIGEHAGQKFMTMELIDGAALSHELTARGPMREAEGLRLFADICRGVAAAHAIGIVHRDLKPGNVMIERGGRVVVTDFGLARRSVDGGDGQTMGQVVGTPAYMAPEQVAAAPVGPPADVYALGLILFEMLSGQRAWRGSSALMVAARRVIEEPPSLTDARADASATVVALVARCLAREPEGRFADARALLEAVELCVGGLDTPASLAALSGLSSLPAPAPAPAQAKTVAVLPFRNLGDKEDAAATAGLSEDLGDVLSMTGGLRVRHSAASPDADPLELGRKLGVDVVVFGAVRRRGDNLRVSVRVLGVADGFALWAGRFERPMSEALALNDEVGQGVAMALAVDEPVVARPAANSVHAAEVYLQLRAAMNSVFMIGANKPILEVTLARAIELAPEDPVVLATWLAVRGWSNSIFGGPWVTPEIEARLHKVLAAAPELASTWHAKAAVEFYGHRQAASAVVSLRHALDINPGHVDARAMLAFILSEAGMLDEAMDHFRRALWSDPANVTLRVNMMHVHAARGNWDGVVELFEGLDTAQWRIQGNIAVARYSWWAGRWLGTPPSELPPLTGAARSIGMSLAVFNRELTRAEFEAGAAEVLAPAVVGSRASVFLRQIMAEGAAYLGYQDFAWRLAREAEEHGQLDAKWLAQNPLMAEVRRRPEAKPLLDAAAARSAEIRAAYLARLD